MVPIEKLTGRLGNMMFIYAFMLNYARTHGITDSYFPQHLEWFNESADFIRAIYSQDIGYDERVGIHVRRKDYLEEDRIQYPLPLEYYEKAMKLYPGRRFVVCSDDIEWCKKQRIFKRCDFSEGSEIEDMNLLASCDGLIIANSSFSWWSAFLNANEGLIVAPEKWDKDNKIFSMPDHWKTL